MNKGELIQALEAKFGSRKAAAEALEHVVDTVIREVAKNGKVAITGFGTFEKIERAARTGRNPRTGEKVRIKKTSVPRFRAGTQFKEVTANPRKLPKDGAVGVRASASSSAAAPAKKAAPARSAAKAASKAAPAKAAASRTAAKAAPAKTAVKKTTAKAAAAATTTARKATAKAAPAKAAATKAPAKAAPARTTARAATAKKASTTASAAKKAPAKKAPARKR